ncbi:MAG: dienelactone hydrolase family protein [Deltaproteobacteria bacterium]|nr:dienelactone hydrolase family protein [Deltaproteobacteria bacterium]
MFVAIACGALSFMTQAHAAIKTQAVEYSAGGTTMQGFVAYDDAKKGPRPGILIVHDWMGLGPFAKDKARQLAGEGYVAFAADIYGKGVRPKSPAEAGKLAGKFKSDRPLLRERVRAAFDKLVAMKQTDAKKVVAMGYCFGGTTALELARSGAPLAGTASFHGGLSTPTPEDAKNIHGPVLAMHGADDPNVPPSEVEAFKEEMKKAGVKMKFVAYPGAVHAFTNPAAGNDNSKGAAYNAEADKKSWVEFEQFLKEAVGG